MPIYCKTESGWKTGLMLWEKRAAGWVMINPLYVKTAAGWEALPFGTMQAPSITSPASGAVIREGSALTVTVSAISSSGFADAGAGTQIQIAKDAAFANIVAAHDGGYTTTLTSPALSAATYYIRARHRGANLGWGPWSATVQVSAQSAMGTATFTSSTTWTAPYDGTFTIFLCGGGGGGSGCRNGGCAGGDTTVTTLSGTSCSLLASGGAGGGGITTRSGNVRTGYTYNNGNPGASSTWYAGGAGSVVNSTPAGRGGGGTGASPYGMGGAALSDNFVWVYTEDAAPQLCGGGGNGGTSQQNVWLARGTVLQLTIGAGATRPVNASTWAYLYGTEGTAGVVRITG